MTTKLCLKIFDEKDAFDNRASKRNTPFLI